jgi:NADPH-dependent 7-cyano-7-deazaguanine reductase QueF
MFLKKKVFKKVLKSFRRVSKSNNSLKRLIFKKVQKVKKI